MLLGIRAPRGTVLTVPDPDENMPRGMRRFEVDLATPGVNAGMITMDMIQPEYMQDCLKKQLVGAASATSAPTVSLLTSIAPAPLNPQTKSVHTTSAADLRPLPPMPPNMPPPPHMPIPTHLFPPGSIPPQYLNMSLPPYAYPHPYMQMPPFVPPPHAMMPSNHPIMAAAIPPASTGTMKDAVKAASEAIAAATATSKTHRRLLPKVADSLKNEVKRGTLSSVIKPEEGTKQKETCIDEDCKLATNTPLPISGTPPRVRNITGTPPRKRAIFDLDSPFKSTPMKSSTLFMGDFHSPGLNLLETPTAGISSFGSFQESPITFQSPMISFARLGDDGDKSGNDDIFFERALFSKSFESKEE